MSHDPTEHAQEHIQHEAAHGGGHGPKWITAAALTAAFLAAFAAVSSSLATKHLTESTLKRIEANDAWNEYQSKSVKKYIMDTRTLAANAADPNTMFDAAAVAKQRKADKEKLAEYATKAADDSPEDPKGSEGVMKKAQRLEGVSAGELHTHETYEMSATMFHIAIAIVAIAVVAKRKEFWYVSMVGGVAGVVFLGSAFSHAPVEAEKPHEEVAATEHAAAEHAPSSGKAPVEHAAPAAEHAPAEKPIETH